MNVKEHGGTACPPKQPPVGERHEMIVRARQRHAVFAGLLQLVAQLEGEIEHDGFFVVAGRRRDRAAVETAMAGIEHDQRPRVRALRGWLAFARRRGAASMILDRSEERRVGKECRSWWS